MGLLNTKGQHEERKGKEREGKEGSELRERFGRIGSRAGESFLLTLKPCQHAQDKSSTTEHHHLLVL